MRHGVLLLAVCFATVAPSFADAQPARVGRLPVLELPPPAVGTCRIDAAPAALQRDGIERVIFFKATDPSSDRIITMGIGAHGESLTLMSMMGTTEARREEGESVRVFFRSDGAIASGRRSAFTTGMPTRLSDDRQLGLLPGDTLAVRRFASALRKRCRV